MCKVKDNSVTNNFNLNITPDVAGQLVAALQSVIAGAGAGQPGGLGQGGPFAGAMAGANGVGSFAMAGPGMGNLGALQNTFGGNPMMGGFGAPMAGGVGDPLMAGLGGNPMMGMGCNPMMGGGLGMGDPFGGGMGMNPMGMDPMGAYQAGLQDGAAAASGQDPYEAGFQEGMKSVQQQEIIQQIVGLLGEMLGGGGANPQGGCPGGNCGNNSFAFASAGFA